MMLYSPIRFVQHAKSVLIQIIRSKALFVGAISTLALTYADAITAHEHASDKHAVHHAQAELGLQLYSLRNEFDKDVPSTMALVKELGFSIVEGGGNLHNTSIEDFKALLIKHEIQVVSADTSFEEVRDNPMGVAYKAKYYGAKYVTIYWVPHDEQIGVTIEHVKELVNILNTGGKILAEQGITLQYHPHGYELRPHGDGTMLDYIIRNTKHAQFQMDVFWIKQAGASPLNILKKYPGRFTSLHLKDRLPGSPYSSNGRADVEKTNVVLGTGDAQIAEVVTEAQKQGIKYYFLEDESSRVVQQLPKSLKFVKSLIE